MATEAIAVKTQSGVVRQQRSKDRSVRPTERRFSFVWRRKEDGMGMLLQWLYSLFEETEFDLLEEEEWLKLYSRALEG